LFGKLSLKSEGIEMSEDNKRELYNYLVNQKYILLAYLFNPQEQQSDDQIDLGVVLQDGLSNFKKTILRFKLMVDLANIFKKQVDVTILNNTPSVLRQQAVKFIKPIFVRDTNQVIG
jgi:hypothetical protein